MIPCLTIMIAFYKRITMITMITKYLSLSKRQAEVMIFLKFAFPHKIIFDDSIQKCILSTARIWKVNAFSHICLSDCLFTGRRTPLSRSMWHTGSHVEGGGRIFMW